MSAPVTNPKRHPWLAVLLLVVAVLVILVAWAINPQNIQDLGSHPNPVSGYAEAVQRIQALKDSEVAAVMPVCQTQFMTHGQKVDRAIILVHGYTSCPEAFRALGERFYALGYNVLIVPQPRSGLSNRLNDDQSQLTAEEVAQYADAVVDIGQGLGTKVTMLGTSGGGVTTAWAAQFRPDLDLAVVVSPAFGYNAIPTPLTAAVMNYYSLVPNEYTWWDATLKADRGPDYTYPRYSSRALVQWLRLGFAVQASAQQTKPAAHALLVITNGWDTSVNNALTKQVVGYWQSHGANLRTYEFDASLRLEHELIDPAKDPKNTEIVQPKIVELVTQ